MCNKSNSVDCDSFEWKMYEKAIEGRNNHYSSYTAWMNLYAIFNGALFVGFYSTLNNEPIVTVVISIIGIISSFCWYCSLSGYYSWMVSWIKVVQGYEDYLNQKHDENEPKTLYVYNVYLENNGKSKEDKDKNDKMKDKVFSTQKITKIFISTLIGGWFFLALFSLEHLGLGVRVSCLQSLYSRVGICSTKYWLCTLTLFLIVFVIVVFILIIKGKLYSDTSSMNHNILGKETKK